MNDLTLIYDYHQRYQDCMPVMGLQCCKRAIVINNANFPEILRCDDVSPTHGFIVRIIDSYTQSDIMMPKFMILLQDNEDEIILRGVSVKVMGIETPAADCKQFGLKLVLKNRNVVKSIFYMYDRRTYIEYFNDMV